MKILIKTILLSIITGALFAQQHVDCYTVIVGKDASFDGSVLLGHNEDDSGEKMLVNWQKVPKKKFKKGDTIELINGYKINQVRNSFSYIWLQVTKKKFADAYMNENSVVICSDACSSREDTASGQIGYFLRQIMAERSISAKHAVKSAGKLIEQLGYESSGRTYCIADKNEAWMLSVVKGKHWVAQRIPDDHVAVIPNYYTIQKVDLSDTINFLASKDLIEYAIKRGWYNPENGEEFNFRNVYGNPGKNKSMFNIPRHISGINKISDKQYGYEDVLPFSFVPKNKVTLDDIKSILTDHYENSDFESASVSNNGNPHIHDIPRICNTNTQFSFIAQLRNNLPNEIGSLMWISAYNGCINPYIPIYLGIINTHQSYRYSTVDACKDIHFKNDTNNLTNFPGHAYYILAKYVDFTESNYTERIEEAKKFKTKIENELKSNQNKLENSVLKVYESYPDDAKKILTKYCNDYFQKVVKHAQNY